MGDGDSETYWIQWGEASGRKDRRLGPFHYQEAVRRIAEDMDLWAAQMEHGTGAAGEWAWDTARMAATLYRGDWSEKPLGHYVIEQVAAEEELFDG